MVPTQYELMKEGCFGGDIHIYNPCSRTGGRLPGRAGSTQGEDAAAEPAVSRWAGSVILLCVYF